MQNTNPLQITFDTKEEYDEFLLKTYEDQLTAVYRDGWTIIERILPPILKNVEGCIVEIGMGASTPMFAKFAERQDITLHSCDKSPRKIIQPLFPKHKIYQMFSFDFMKTFDDTPAIVFLDGSHEYDVVKKEFEFFLDKLTEGGIIFIHDTGAPEEQFLNDTACGDIWKLRQEIERRRDVDCLTWPYTAINCGLTMILKREVDAPYWRACGR